MRCNHTVCLYFGVPMLGNDVPGLKYTIELNGFGITCDDSSEESILNGIKTIEDNYQEMSAKARNYYESVDNKETIKEVINIIK